MRLTIIAADGAVGIDGEFFYGLDLPQLALGIHAVQWYDTYGEVEYKSKLDGGVLVKPVNTMITDVGPYQFAIDAWNAAKEQAAEAAILAQQAATQTGFNAG